MQAVIEKRKRFARKVSDAIPLVGSFASREIVASVKSIGDDHQQQQQQQHQQLSANLTEACETLNALGRSLPETIGKIQRAKTVIQDEVHQEQLRAAKRQQQLAHAGSNNGDAADLLVAVTQEDPARAARQRRASRQFEMATRMLQQQQQAS